MHVTNDEDRGLYNKFIEGRTDGSSDRGGKHENCRYFVLDINHDPNSIPALIAYANACEEKFPNLARDIRMKLVEKPKEEEQR